MLRTVIITFLLLHTFQNAAAQDDDEDTDVLGKIFDTDAGCNKSIEGEIAGGGCYECYICNDYGSKTQKDKSKNDYKIRLYDNKCVLSEFCCYSQKDSVARFSQTSCGNTNPDGFPRSTRNSLRSVLPGEYPWRAWIFSKSNLNTPLCAGVYIDTNTRAILTSAHCVDDYIDEDLMVGFTRHRGSLHVRGLVVHDYYDRQKRHNDIAIVVLSFSDNLPPWAYVACMPTAPPLFATACITVSKDDNYVNTIIPKQSHCFEDKGGNESILCAAAPKDDYEPEFSGGLFCEKETSVRHVSFFLYGIYLYKDHRGVPIYTNISNYAGWIDDGIRPYL